MRCFKGFPTRSMGLAFMLLLSACQTTEQMQMESQASLNAAYRGRQLSDFIMANGIHPQETFEMPGERVFMFGPPCVSWWYTRRIANRGTPADFEVVRVEVRGYCRTD